MSAQAARGTQARAEEFPVLRTTSVPEAEANRAEMGRLCDDLAALHDRATEGGGEKYVARHRGRGKMLVRERIDLLVDQGAHFLELSPLAGWGTDSGLGGGLVTGIGRVSGVDCMIIGNDATMRGGARTPAALARNFRALAIAEENRLPVINLTESGGADLTRQSEIFVYGGEQFRRLTELSAQGIATITVVFGSSTAGGAYVPGMSDYTIFVEDQAQVFLGGPPLVRMATGEIADPEQLGGAAMHSRVSGLSDFLAADEEDALLIARRVVASLGHEPAGPGPERTPVEPVRPVHELLDVIPADARRPLETRDVLARLVDGSRFLEFKPEYGANMVTGWAHVGGYRVGILANNGVIFSPEAQKAAQFITVANRTHTPLLFVQNITGFMVGTEYEQRGIIKDGAKLINAVSNSTVPHITLMVGASYGAGNYAMAGRAFKPRFVFTWPNHRIAVMGAKQAAGVLETIRRTADEKAGRPHDAEATAAIANAAAARIEEESSALFATGKVWDDGVIDPRDTRDVLTIALAACHSAPVQGSSTFGLFRF